MAVRDVGRVLLPRGGGDVVMEGPSSAIVRLYGEETGGLVSVIENPIEPGVLIPPHVHLHNDVWAYVLSGEVHFRVGDDVVKASPGDWVRKPRGIPHVFWNSGPAPANFVEVFTPAGFEHFFKDLAELVRSGKPLDALELEKLGERYGWKPLMDWVPEIEATYNVTLWR